MKIAYSPYLLNGSNMEREGALLQVRFSDSQIGYADCHPWPELGDPPLQKQLESLFCKKPTSLLKRSLAFAQLDAVARSKGVHLLSGRSVPDSHYLVMDMKNVPLEQLMTEGFLCFKFKVGVNLSQELFFLKSLLEKVPEARLDFNFRLDYEDYMKFMNELKPFWNKIAFCEDPFPYNLSLWKKAEEVTGIPLALDRSANVSHVASYRVLKPAIEEPKQFEKLVVTSYLGHPFEQVCAAYIASCYTTALCGLQSHYTYETNTFSALLSKKGPRFQIPSGTGFGFDEQLKQCIWKSL